MSIHDYQPVNLAAVMHCTRCGNIVGDLIQHDTHHDLLDSIAAAAGRTLDGARKLTADQLNERLRSPQQASWHYHPEPEKIRTVALSCSCGRAAVQATATMGADRIWRFPWHFLGRDHDGPDHARTARFDDEPVTYTPTDTNGTRSR